MKKIYHIYTEENGEMEWFFDEDYKVITYWWINDATWRSEYMGGLLEHCGAEVVDVDEHDKKHPAVKVFKKELKKI